MILGEMLKLVRTQEAITCWTDCVYTLLIRMFCAVFLSALQNNDIGSRFNLYSPTTQTRNSIGLICGLIQAFLKPNGWHHTWSYGCVCS